MKPYGWNGSLQEETLGLLLLLLYIFFVTVVYKSNHTAPCFLVAVECVYCVCVTGIHDYGCACQTLFTVVVPKAGSLCVTPYCFNSIWLGMLACSANSTAFCLLPCM